MSVRTAPSRATQRRRQRRALVAGALALGAVVIGVFLANGSGSGSTAGRGAADDGAAPASLLATLSSIAPSALARAAASAAAVSAPTPFSSAPLLSGGRPEILFVGAEYCPYCAAERWAMIAALSHFGRFTGLRATHSSTTDVFPDTQTFSFHGSAYASRWLTFTAVETKTNQWTGAGYAPLDSVTADQARLVHTYDFPPYVPDDHAGAIPWIDLGGRWLVSGASFDPAVLAGKTREQIAAAVADPASDIAKLVDAAAGALTSDLCALTRGQPAGVCTAFG